MDRTVSLDVPSAIARRARLHLGVVAHTREMLRARARARLASAWAARDRALRERGPSPLDARAVAWAALALGLVAGARAQSTVVTALVLQTVLFVVVVAHAQRVVPCAVAISNVVIVTQDRRALLLVTRPAERLNPWLRGPLRGISIEARAPVLLNSTVNVRAR